MMAENRSAKWLVFLGIGCLAIGCGSAAQDERGEAAVEVNGLPDRDPELALRLVEQEGALLLDVRTTEEFAEGHIEGAVNIAVQQLEERIGDVGQLVGADLNKPIVVYCRSGRRSATAKEILLQAGHTRVTNLGGLSDWPASR